MHCRRICVKAILSARENYVERERERENKKKNKTVDFIDCMV
jgi:hypothetical protein